MWEAVAKRLGFESERGMWEEYYTNKKWSLTTLATKFASSPHTVKSRIKMCGVSLRARGGPHNVKIVLTDEVLDSIKKIGIPSTAKLFGWTPQALYNRVLYSKGERIRDIKARAAEELRSEAAENAPTASQSESPKTS